MYVEEEEGGRHAEFFESSSEDGGIVSKAVRSGMVAVSPDERKEPVPTSLKVFLVGLGFARTKSLERPARPFLTAVDRRPTYLNLPSTAGQSLLEDQLRFLSTTRVIPKNAPLSLPPTRFLERERHENPSSTSRIFSFDAAVFFFFFFFKLST